MSWTERLHSLRSSIYAIAILALAITVMWGAAQFNTTTAEASGGSDAPSAHLMFTGTGVGAIPDDNPAGLNVTFNVTGVVTPVSDIWISMDLTHSWVGDIDATLSAPNGTQHVIFASTGATTATGTGSAGDSSDLAGNYRFIDNATGTNWWAAAAAVADPDPIPPGDYRTTQAGPQTAANFSPVTSITTAFAGVTNPNGTWTLNVSDNALEDTGSINASILAIAGTTGPPATPRDRYDFLGSPLADFAIFTFPTGGTQLRWVAFSNDNPTVVNSAIIDQPWGNPQNAIIPNVGNYIDDNRTDFNVYFNDTGTPVANTYAILGNNGGAGSGTQKFEAWGNASTDVISVEGDYNGDGVLDFTAVRAANANDPFTWYILNSGTNTFTSFVYGSSTTDIPLAGADYVGDVKDDPTVIRIGGGGVITFYVGTTIGTVLKNRNWGSFATDFVLPGGDYDGDGKADFAVWRGFGAGTNGVWYILRQDDTSTATPFGIGGAAADRDTALRGGDYDGDGKADIAVYRPSNGNFIVRRSSDMGTVLQQVQFPGNVNLPIASFGSQ